MSAEVVLYTAAEVADLLRLNHQVVQRKLQAGDIPGYRIGREWRVERSQLLGWLERHSNQHDRTLDPFFDAEGRLRTIPTQRKQRDAVMRRLVEELEPNRVYAERELNALLRRFHPDVATLRRELVAAKLVVRTPDGVYKRTALPP